MSDQSSVLKALEKELAKGKFDEVLALVEDVLAADPNNADARHLKETALRRKQLMSRAQASTKVAVSQLKCCGCGGPLKRTDKSSVVCICSGCGTSNDISGSNAANAGKLSRLPKKSHSSFLPLGIQGTVLGKRYEVIGKALYDAKTEEWDDEDNCYTSSRWQWEEVTLLGEDRTYLYLVFDAEGVTLARSFNQAQGPQFSDRPTTLALDGGGPRRVEERGVATLSAAEGEFTWIPRPHEVIRFAEYNRGAVNYSVEWRMDRLKVLEVEFFRAEPISIKSLLTGFNCKAELEQYNRDQAARAESVAWIGAFAGAFVLMLILAAASANESGTVLYETSFPQLSAISDEGTVVGPFELNDKGTVHSIRLNASIPDNSEEWAGAELLDAEQDAINVGQGEFWRESGRDSDGSWSESDVESNSYFRLDQPGTYYLRVFGEPGINGGDGFLSVRIVQGVSLARFYLAGAFAAGVCMLMLARGLGRNRRTGFGIRTAGKVLFWGAVILLFIWLDT